MDDILAKPNEIVVLKLRQHLGQCAGDDANRRRDCTLITMAKIVRADIFKEHVDHSLPVGTQAAVCLERGSAAAHKHTSRAPGNPTPRHAPEE